MKEMGKMSCADAVVEALEEQGVRHVFIGPPGEHVVELYDALLDSKKIQGYLTTNEYTLSFMADGYSRRTGEAGVFTCVPGPGVTNALTGIAEAFLDSSPLVGIISDVRAHIDEAFQLHQMPQMEVLKPVIKKGYRIDDPGRVRKVLAEAFQVARSGEPGPVMIEIPCDVYPLRGKRGGEPISPLPPPLDRDRVARFAEILKSSKQCGLYVGRGCFHGAEEVLRLSELLQAPVASSVSGRGILPEDHPLSVGFGFGSNGTPFARKIFGECDTVLAIGCKFGEVSSGSYSFKLPKNFIHVDINPDNLNKVFRTGETLAADAKLFLVELLRRMEGYGRKENSKLRARIRKGKWNFFGKVDKVSRRAEGVDPGKFYSELRRRMGREDTLTVDIGNHELWAISCFPVLAPGTFLCPTNFSSMGFAIPAAIAAKIARPDRRAVCCVGDGGFLMSGFEILTAVRERLAIPFFVFNDGAFGITKGLQKRLFKRTAFVDLQNPDYQKLAASYAIPYFRIDGDREIRPVLDQIWQLDRPSLIDLRVRYDRMSPFLKGMVRHRIRMMPWREKLHVLRRLVRRTVLP
jgi:acetolactate synthase-1/2/3 large subunit